LDLAYYVMVSLPDGFVDRYEVMTNLNEHLAKPLIAKPFDREAWMRSPQVVAGQRAMIAQAGGPAPLRDPEVKRPEAWKAREGASP
jgi:hypothetical protein